MSCIFCGGTPQTKTHVMRKAWIDGLLLGTPGPRQVVHESGAMTGAAREVTRPAREFDIAPGAACGPCNHGWLDTVDQEAERIVEPMVLGHDTTISRLTDQRTVARWVSQVCILIDQTQVERAVPHELAAWYHDNRDPLPGIRVWLGRTVPEWNVEVWERAWKLVTRSYPDTGYRLDAGLFTFRIVNLVVQALVPFNRPTADFTRDFDRGENMRFLKQLWPSQFTPITWPPPVAIHPDSMRDFARAFEPPDAVLGETWKPWGG